MGGWDLIITCPVTRSCCLVDLDNFYADYCKSHLQISHFLQIQMWREMSSYLSHTLAHDLIISLTRTQIPEIEMRELSFQSVQSLCVKFKVNCWSFFIFHLMDLLFQSLDGIDRSSKQFSLSFWHLTDKQFRANRKLALT